MPELTIEKMIQRLVGGKPLAAIVLVGTDVYLRDLCRNKIIDACVPESARDWAVVRIPGNTQGWQEVLARAQTMPMLAPRQVIVVEDAETIESLGERSRDEILAGLETYLQSPAPVTILLLQASAFDMRLRFSKVLAEKALLVRLSIGDASAAMLAAEIAKELGAEIDREAAALLADILNGEPARMRIELEKLAVYVQGRGRIVAGDVEALVVAARKNTVWQLADLLATRRRNDALAFLDNLLREGEQPVGLVGALAWMYRKLIEARDLPVGISGFQAARQLGMRPEAADAAIQNAHRLPKKELIAGLVALAETDSQLKSSNPDPRPLMEFLIARLTAAPAS